MVDRETGRSKKATNEANANDRKVRTRQTSFQVLVVTLPHKSKRVKDLKQKVALFYNDTSNYRFRWSYAVDFSMYNVCTNELSVD